MASIKLNGVLFHRRGIHGDTKRRQQASANRFRKQGYYARVLPNNTGGYDLYVSGRKR